MYTRARTVHGQTGEFFLLLGAVARLCIIKSTLHLDEILISPSLVDDLGSYGSVISEKMNIEFDDLGNLIAKL